MKTLKLPGLTLLLLAMMFSISHVAHCEMYSTEGTSSVPDCHKKDREPNPSNKEEKPQNCCLASTSCCVVFFQNSQLIFLADQKTSYTAPFLEDCFQSQAYSLPWKPPKLS